ncbi:hypothetical protein COMA2_70106 [Candidatus Nitrospira nitrificans]|uniref:Uncharacterized protein n=1 Tax=Candidatus Nitrospira nitrificans TaxID=1742973 RepID=A0A0S4LQ24_9BACT|nr:hypothetical protein COMA2_70106 [Candidatus Nitrospira nitrificans]
MLLDHFDEPAEYCYRVYANASPPFVASINFLLGWKDGHGRSP